MEPNVRLLRYFLAIAEERNFTRAADRLYVSQPALSQQIRRLERDLGFPLFRRDTREVSLTAQGQELLSTARIVISAADDFDREARRLGDGPRRLTLGFRARAANELTTRILDAYAQIRPDVEVVLQQVPLEATKAGLDTGESDIAFLRLPVDLTGLDHLLLLTEGRVAVLNDAHPLAGRSTLTRADLTGYPWITTAAPDPLWQNHTHIPEEARSSATVVHSAEAYLEAVLAGRGIALAPESAARFYPRPGIRYVPVTDADPSTMALVWRAETPGDNPAAAAFIDTVRRLLDTYE